MHPNVIKSSRYQGYWYHPRFHQLSNEDDIRDIQSSRRRRGQGSSSSKSTKPTEPAHSIKSRKSAEVQRGLIELPEQECAHMLVLDSMASLFPLASLAKDAILTGGFVESEKDATPNSILDSQRGLGMGSTESHPLSGVLSCTPIKPNNFAVPFLRSAFSPHMGAVTGLIDYYEGFDDNKENLTGVADQVNPYQLAFDQYSPTTPVNQLSMCRRSSPFAYDCRLTQLLCSPNRQRPGDNLAENRKPILFSFHGDLPVAGLASLNALQPKKPPAHQCDANCESESNSKPAAVKRIS